MNSKRQTVWLVSMLSLMVILSAYYLFTENPGTSGLKDTAQTQGGTSGATEVSGNPSGIQVQEVASAGDAAASGNDSTATDADTTKDGGAAGAAAGTDAGKDGAAATGADAGNDSGAATGADAAKGDAGQTGNGSTATQDGGSGAVKQGDQKDGAKAGDSATQGQKARRHRQGDHIGCRHELRRSGGASAVRSGQRFERIPADGYAQPRSR